MDKKGTIHNPGCDCGCKRKELQTKLTMLIKVKSKKREEMVVKEKWAIVRVIPISEEQIPCCSKKCSKNMAVSWASNLNPEDNWDLCEDCQVGEFGEWPDGVVPIKTLADSNGGDNKAMACLDKRVNLNRKKR